MKTLVIVIVSHNTRSDLENCLQSLHEHPPRVPHEIVVVDNASGDGSIAAVRSRWPDVRVIPLNSNVGFASANNEGIRRTESDLLLLLNSDTVVAEGSLDRLIAALHELPGASIVGPRIVDGAGRPELSYGRMLTPLSELRQKLLVRYASPRRLEELTSKTRRVDWVTAASQKLLVRYASPRRLEELTSKTRRVDWVTAACLLVRRRDADAAGLLDERYFMYGEDVDFCAAVRANGGIVYFTPLAQIVHLRGRSWGTRSAASAESYSRSQLAFYQKHHPRWVPLLKAYLRFRGKLPQ